MNPEDYNDDDDVLLPDELNPSPPHKVSLTSGEQLIERERDLRELLLQRRAAAASAGDTDSDTVSATGRPFKFQRIEQLQDEEGVTSLASGFDSWISPNWNYVT